MTEPIEDGEDTQRIEKEAKSYFDKIDRADDGNEMRAYIAGATAQLKELASLREQLKQQQELVSLRESQQDVMATDTVKLMDQIEYQNKSAKESNDRIMRLEFELKQKQDTVSSLEKQLAIANVELSELRESNFLQRMSNNQNGPW